MIGMVLTLPDANPSSPIPARGGPDIGGSAPITASKRMVEMGQIAKARIIGDDADRKRFGTRIAQQVMRAQQPLLQHEIGKRRAGIHEQRTNVSGRYAVARGNRIHREIAARKMAGDIGLDGAKAGKSNAATFGEFAGVTVRADRQPDQVVQVIVNGKPKAWRHKLLLVMQHADVVFKQSKGRVILRDRADERILRMRKPSRQLLPVEPKVE
jgi:hypothetical protein